MSFLARATRAIRMMVAVVAVAFVAELLVMSGLGLVLDWHRPMWLALLDALLLAVLIAPPLYFLLLRPMRREYERRFRAERRAALASELAITDALTEVLNRRGIKARLLEAMAQAERYGRPLSLVMLDLDGLKRINDRNGHAAGDEALRRVASVVKGSLRSPDSVGRFGGDEFLMVLPETPLSAAQALTARIAQVLRESELDVAGRTERLSASFGEVEFEADESLERLLARVDRALYRAKRRAGPQSPPAGEEGARLSGHRSPEAAGEAR